MFCHYMLSSGGLVGRFCPMVQVASATHLSAGGSLSRLRFGRRIGSFGPQNGGQKARRQTRPLSLASPVPCLRGAVEFLLTGDQHKPCASFNQQARKNTTSVAHFGVQKWTRFGACLAPETGVKIKASNKVAFIGLHCSASSRMARVPKWTLSPKKGPPLWSFAHPQRTGQRCPCGSSVAPRCLAAGQN